MKAVTVAHLLVLDEPEEFGSEQSQKGRRVSGDLVERRQKVIAVFCRGPDGAAAPCRAPQLIPRSTGARPCIAVVLRGVSDVEVHPPRGLYGDETRRSD